MPLILPPEYKRLAGRPLSVRIRGAIDEGRKGIDAIDVIIVNI